MAVHRKFATQSWKKALRRRRLPDVQLRSELQEDHFFNASCARPARAGPNAKKHPGAWQPAGFIIDDEQYFRDFDWGANHAGGKAIILIHE